VGPSSEALCNIAGRRAEGIGKNQQLALRACTQQDTRTRLDLIRRHAGRHVERSNRGRCIRKSVFSNGLERRCKRGVGNDENLGHGYCVVNTPIMGAARRLFCLAERSQGQTLSVAEKACVRTVGYRCLCWMWCRVARVVLQCVPAGSCNTGAAAAAEAIRGAADPFVLVVPAACPGFKAGCARGFRVAGGPDNTGIEFLCL
jgi:hypothetical protein